MDDALTSPSERQRAFRLTIGYDGTEYAGWQIQVGQPTIQGQLERAVARLLGHRVPITGSGRTDSGVHALAQVASMTTEHWRHSADALARAINTKIPDDISVYQCREMPLGFHAIRDATGKRYRYCLQSGGVRDAFAHRYSWHCHDDLDISAMRQAAAHIVGTHDFACFQASGSDRKTSVRTIRDLVITQQQGRAGGQNIQIEVEADGFLYNMVRNIVGSLVEVGRGKQSAGWITGVIESQDRKLAGPTAPAQGLFLMHVQYGEETITGL